MVECAIEAKYDMSRNRDAPGKVKTAYPRWLYWFSRYGNAGLRTMGKVLTADKLAQDLFVMMTASIHSTSGAGLCIIFDMLAHPDALLEIQEEISRVQAANPIWTRKALGELCVLDSFMRESARFHARTQYTAVHQVLTAPWTSKDGLTIPAGTTLQFLNYHYNFDPCRHIRKRQVMEENTYRFHFASVANDMLNWGTGWHACPGRFFAQETLMLMIIHLLTHYELRHVENQTDTSHLTLQ
ncbi:cytochrome P450 [Nemania serpens]|nr:cytochrome P450 [Nemania serpens]